MQFAHAPVAMLEEGFGDDVAEPHGGMGDGGDGVWGEDGLGWWDVGAGAGVGVDGRVVEDGRNGVSRVDGVDGVDGADVWKLRYP